MSIVNYFAEHGFQAGLNRNYVLNKNTFMTVF